jgi:hypothetical protein
MDTFLETVTAWEAAGRPVLHNGIRKYVPSLGLSLLQEKGRMVMRSNAAHDPAHEVEVTTAPRDEVTADLSGTQTGDDTEEAEYDIICNNECLESPQCSLEVALNLARRYQADLNAKVEVRKVVRLLVRTCQ